MEEKECDEVSLQCIASSDTSKFHDYDKEGVFATASSCSYGGDVDYAESSLFPEEQLGLLQCKLAMNATETELKDRNLLEKIGILESKLNEKDEEVTILKKELNAEEECRRQLQAENLRFQDIVEELEKCQQTLMNQLEQKRKQHEADVNVRDRAINAIVRRCQVAGVPEVLVDASENGVAVATDITNILHHFQEAAIESVVMSSEANHSVAAENTKLEQFTVFNDTLSIGDDLSGSNAKEFVKKCRGHSVDQSLLEQIQYKLTNFDVSRGCDNSIVMSYAQNDDASMNITGLSTSDASRTMSKEVDKLKETVSVIRKICVQLFERLRGSAETFQKVLCQLYGKNEGRSLLNEVEQMCLDFSQSVDKASFLLSNFEGMQKSILELTKDSSDVRMKIAEKKLDSKRSVVVETEVEVLTKKLQELQANNQKLSSDRNKIEMNMSEIRWKLEEANDEIDAIKSECVSHVEELSKLKSENEEKEKHLSQVSSLLKKTERECARYKAYFEELASVEQESKRLIQSLRGTISSILQKVVKVVTEDGDIVGDKEEALKVIEGNKDVVVLRNKFNQMRATIDEACCNVKTLKKQKEAVEAELANLKKKLKDGAVARSVQTSTLRSHEVLLPNTQKHDADKGNRVVCMDLLFKPEAEAMTSLCCVDIVKMECRLLAYSSFANDIYEIITSNNDRPFDQMDSLNIRKLDRLKLEVSKAVLKEQKSKQHFARPSLKQLSSQSAFKYNSSGYSFATAPHHFQSSDASNFINYAFSTDDAANGLPLSKMLSDKFWRQIYDHSNEIVQLVKSQDCEWNGKDKLLDKVRTFRSKIYFIREQILRLGKAKEITNASVNLSDDPVRILIRDEMAKIRDVMKTAGKAASHNKTPTSCHSISYMTAEV
uniref:DUF5741 domain-containing protein n=1 Tax=Syphacia muris TaxID=451379 RepID=A0A0N5AZW0_9BILA